jgi:hypothetical protein
MAAGELSADRDTSAIPGQICRDENRDIAPFSAKFPRAPLAAIGHVNHVGAGHHLEELARDMREVPTPAVAMLTRPGLALA